MNNGILLFWSVIVIGTLIVALYEVFRHAKTKDDLSKTLYNYDKQVLKTDKLVTCEKCKSLIHTSDINVVEVKNYNFSSSDYCTSKYYCEECQPPYTRVVNYNSPGNKYYKEFEVDINGKIIK